MRDTVGLDAGKGTRKWRANETRRNVTSYKVRVVSRTPSQVGDLQPISNLC